MLENTNATTDMVVFMTAYHFPKITMPKKKRFLKKKRDMLAAMKKHHIEAVFCNDVVVSQLGRMDFKSSFDDWSRHTTMTFSAEQLAKESHDKILHQMAWSFHLKNEMTALFDRDILQPAFFYRLEPFFVYLQEKVVKVDALAYTLTNGILCTAFTLYDCAEKRILSAHDVYGRNHHYHLCEVNRISNDGEIWTDIEATSISHITSERVGLFNLEALNVDFIQNGFTFYHSMLIMSNEISDYEEYAKDVVGADRLSMPLKDISPTKECMYFSQECFAIVSAYEKDNFGHLLYRQIALESLKLYYFVNMIVSYEQTTSLSETYQQVLRLEILEHMIGTPVLTIEVLNNIRQMSTYAKLKEAMNFKLDYLNTKQEQRRNENATLLNLLLYALTLVGTVGTVYDLAKEFCWPIPWVLSFVVIAFVILGGLWYKRERDKK